MARQSDASLIAREYWEREANRQAGTLPTTGESRAEVTKLTPGEEARFQGWVRRNRITDVDAPDSHYDYRGYWKEFGDKPVKFGVDHFTDTYKQHGHPTFSVESKYSSGPNDGGRWDGDNYISQTPGGSADLAKKFGGTPVADLAAQFGGTPVDDTAENAPKSLTARALTFLPDVGGTIGGIVGGPVGAAIGGAAGKGLQTTAEHITEIPGAVADVARNIFAHPAETIGGGIQGMGEGLHDAESSALWQGGAQFLGGKVTQGAKTVAGGLMQSAAKPSTRMLERGATVEDMPAVVNTLLKEGISVTKGGAQKLAGLLKATKGEIDALIDGSARTVSASDVARTGRTAVARVGQQVAPSADRAAARGVIQDFIDTKGRDAVTRAPKRFTLREAQDLKTGTYRALKDRAYGETKTAGVEAEKQLARGLKEGIERQMPEVRGLNAREGNLIAAKEAIEHRIGLAANRDPGGLMWLAENPNTALAFILARSPAVKSMLARGLYSSASKASGVPENIIRYTVGAVASSADDEGAQ